MIINVSDDTDYMKMTNRDAHVMHAPLQASTSAMTSSTARTSSAVSRVKCSPDQCHRHCAATSNGQTAANPQQLASSGAYSDSIHAVYIYIYTYIYICVCVCVHVVHIVIYPYIQYVCLCIAMGIITISGMIHIFFYIEIRSSQVSIAYQNQLPSGKLT